MKLKLLTVFTLWFFCMATNLVLAKISEKDIVALEKDFAEAGENSSTTRKRLAYKRVVRDGMSLVKSSPEAEQRWVVLGTVLQGQKQLFALDDSNRNLETLMEICQDLLKAPDAFAELRLEADLLVSERELSLADADVQARAVALKELLGRYRDTPGEAKSLMVASQIAPKLEAFDLEIEILRTMQDRFADHHGVIEFRRKSLSAGRIEALFRGTFKRADGTELCFPVDRLGHPSLIVFWSGKTPGFEVALKQINVHQEMFPERFDIYSFNLDELPDWGQKILRSQGLDWTVLQLPEGKQNQTFRTYGLREPVSILSNAYGYTLLRPTENYRKGSDGKINPYLVEDVRLTSDRYLAQLQSLFIGDFLVTGEDTSAGVPREISECFPMAPHRYRLSRSEALTNYEKAEQLCSEFLKQNPDSKEMWRVKNRKLIGLLGMWKMAGEPKYLAQAVEEAKAMLEKSLPEGADIVPRFCLAKQQLRSSGENAKQLFVDFLETAGKGSAREKALAALVILSLDANSKELHQHYRQLLLEKEVADSSTWPVVAFLRDRFHRLDLLKVKLSRSERQIRNLYGDFVSPRVHCINHSIEPMTRKFPDIQLQDLDGTDLDLPEATKGKLTLLVFVEPPVGKDADFPIVLDRKGNPTKNDPLRKVMEYAKEMSGRHIYNEVEVITAFLSEDKEQAKALMEKNEWPFRIAMVPGGLNNPMVRQLGVLSADQIPNVYLLRRDSTIAWHNSGFHYKSDFGYPFATRLAIKVHIEKCDTALAFQALQNKNFEEAKRIFSGPFLPEKDERYLWRAPRYHGRALANVGLQDWDAALADIDVAIDYYLKNFKRPIETPSSSTLEMLQLKTYILKKLGRKEEAQQVTESVPNTPTPYTEYIYDTFHKRLADLKLTE